MKKLLSLVLAGIMMLSCISVFADESAEGKSASGGGSSFAVSKEDDVIIQRTELAQLYDIGIMEDVGSGPYQSITRAEMAKIITQALNMSNITMSNTFSDIPNDNPYTNQIGVVQSMKIMCGCGNDIFKPDAEITYYEVAKTIVTMLGYEPLAQQKGGYPHGYLKVGNEIGIIVYPGMENKVVTKDDIAKILIKAIDVPLMQQTSFGNTTEYQISEDTIKTRYLGIK